MNDTEKAIVKKVGDDFIQALPSLLTGEVSKLPTWAQPIASGLITLALPSLLPTIQGWFDAMVA